MAKDKNCVFNKYVDCEEHDNCIKCVWNPAVEEKRKAKLAEKKEGD